MPLLLCPNCNASMQNVSRSGVELDMCSQCRGVWLDRGELDKIVEQQRAAYHVEARLHAQRVGPAEQQPVLLRVGGVEDVLRNDANLANRRSGRLEFRERGQRQR